jgi:hypothetical protein
VVEWLTTLPCIREVPGLNLGRRIPSEVLCGFLQSLEENVGIVRIILLNREMGVFKVYL